MLLLLLLLQLYGKMCTEICSRFSCRCITIVSIMIFCLLARCLPMIASLCGLGVLPLSFLFFLILDSFFLWRPLLTSVVLFIYSIFVCLPSPSWIIFLGSLLRLFLPALVFFRHWLVGLLSLSLSSSIPLSLFTVFSAPSWLSSWIYFRTLLYSISRTVRC